MQLKVICYDKDDQICTITALKETFRNVGYELFQDQQEEQQRAA